MTSKDSSYCVCDSLIESNWYLNEQPPLPDEMHCR